MRPEALRRRDLLASSAMALVLAACAGPASLPPPAAEAAPFFTAEEAATIAAAVDRLIPPDAATPGGREAGCADFIDRQLAGPYGRSADLYMRPPFAEGIPQQGPQSPLTPARRYRQALAALATYCRNAYAGQEFAQLPPAEQDRILRGLEAGSLHLPGANGHAFFELLLANTMEGFFADPIYGGNRDMAGWRMVGFPGTRYDYRDYVALHNQPYPLPPVGLAGRPAWHQPA